MRIYLLAGGEGTRMQPYSEIVNKNLLPIGGKPCCRILIERLMEHGFDDIVICTNKPWESMFKHEFRDLDMKFSITERSMGTAIELYYGLKNYPPSLDFGVVYADDITETDYKLMQEEHKKKNNDVTIAVTANVSLEVGIVHVKDSVVIGFEEKPLISDLLSDTYVWSGTAFFKASLTPFFVVNKDIAKDIFPRLINGFKVGAFISNAPWYDAGQISHFKKLKEIYEK